MNWLTDDVVGCLAVENKKPKNETVCHCLSFVQRDVHFDLSFGQTLCNEM